MKRCDKKIKNGKGGITPHECIAGVKRALRAMPNEELKNSKASRHTIHVYKKMYEPC